MSCKDDQQVPSSTRSFPDVRKKLRRSLSESSIIFAAEGQSSPGQKSHNTSGDCNNNNNSSSNGENGNLYAKVREKLHKVHRISKTGLTAPKTPSKPGVYAETNVGKFAQIKSLFDRRCRPGANGANVGKNSIVAGARDRVRIANSIVRRFANCVNSSTTKPRRLYNSEFDSPDRVSFDTRKGIVKLESSISESPDRRDF